MAEEAVRHHPRILVVDDEDNARLLARVALERLDCTVHEAASGEQALEMAHDGLPDLILLDVVMPPPDGFAVCRTLRADQRFRNTPIVMMTALEEPDAVEHAYAAGATDFITKPVNWALLQHRARFVLRAADTVTDLAKSRTRLEEAQRIGRLGSFSWTPATDLFQGSHQLWQLLRREPGAVNDQTAFVDLVEIGSGRYVATSRAAARTTAQPYEIEYRIELPDGSYRKVVERGEWVDDPRRGGQVVGTLQDVTDERMQSEQLRYMTTHDPVTGLLSHAGLVGQLGPLLQDANSICLLHVDLGCLDRTVEAHGHDAGTELLETCGQRLREWLAALGRPASVGAARLGGEQFAVVVAGTPGEEPEPPSELAAALLARMTPPIDRFGAPVYPGVRVGVARAPQDADSAESLLRRGHLAAHAADAGGWRRYESEQERRQLLALSLEDELRGALDRNEVHLEFQPIVEIASGAIRSCEALVRWTNREFGRITPDKFIPLAEEIGFIEELGEWILLQACREAYSWREAEPRAPAVAVNLSARQFTDPARLLAAVERSLASSGLSPERLEVELTESLLVSSAGQVAPTLDVFRSLGIQISLDDFGTGFSSLSYLTRFPFDTLKVDRSFLADLPGDPRRENLVRAVIRLGHGLGLRIITEGVETDDQLRFLAQQRCDFAQGYLLSKPLRADDLRKLLATGLPLADPARRTRAAS